MKTFLFKLKNVLLNIFLPLTCHHCGRDLPSQHKDPLCRDCTAQLKEPGPLICLRCGVSLPNGGAHCHSCRGTKGDSFKCKIIRSALVFNPAVSSLIHNYKYYNHKYLSSFLSSKMCAAFDKTKEFADVDVICPVPLHKFKLRTRGYNQSELLARSLANTKEKLYDGDLLLRAKRTSAQATLGKEQRILNVKDAFVCNKDLKGKVILVIDDVSTTGSTLEECAIALKKAKAKKVYALTAAREE